MDIKIMVGDKEVIVLDFLIDIEESNKILNICIKNFSNTEQKEFLSLLKSLTNENLIINSDYMAIQTEKVVYLLRMSKYKDYKFENALISGYYDLMFAFVDVNDMIYDNEYYIFKLNGHPITELQ